MNESTGSQQAPSTDNNAPKKKKGQSKLGRKGDPRMHKAVAARLAKPELTLLEALRVGGFEFPANGGDDALLLDSDQVTLGQRKNQLSRRLRLAKQSSESNNNSSGNSSPPTATATKKRRKSSASSSQAQAAEYEKLMQHASPTSSYDDTNKKQRALSISDEVLDDAAAEDGDVQDSPSRMAKFHPNFHPLFVAPPPAAAVAAATTTQWQQQKAAAQQAQTMAAATSWDHQQQQQQQIPMNAAALATTRTSPLNFAQPPSGVAIASLNATAGAAGMTLEQLAMSLSSSPNLGMVLRHQTNDASKSKQALALNLYKNERMALYKRCMLLAGFDARETNENHPAHIQFVLEAWQGEGRRLERMHTAATNDEESKDEGSSQENDYGHDHSQSHAADTTVEGCFDGRHVHRLEGKCGHKAIVHQPEDGPAHVDFVINGKVECYQGIKPVGSKAAFWRSRFKCDQIDCNAAGSDHHTVTCGPQNCENECAGVNKKDPKTIELSEIDFEGKEWNSDFFSTTNGQDETLLGLIRLGDNSPDDTGRNCTGDDAGMKEM